MIALTKACFHETGTVIGCVSRWLMVDTNAYLSRNRSNGSMKVTDFFFRWSLVDGFLRTFLIAVVVLGSKNALWFVVTYTPYI